MRIQGISQGRTPSDLHPTDYKDDFMSTPWNGLVMMQILMQEGRWIWRSTPGPHEMKAEAAVAWSECRMQEGACCYVNAMLYVTLTEHASGCPFFQNVNMSKSIRVLMLLTDTMTWGSQNVKHSGEMHHSTLAKFVYWNCRIVLKSRSEKTNYLAVVCLG